MRSARTPGLLGLTPFFLPLFIFLFEWEPSSLGLFEVRRSPSSFPGSGRVIIVHDADTIGVRFADGSEQRVRLIGVDAPELDDPREEVSLKAHLAKRFAFFHLYNQEITLTYDQPLRDKHGRLLAYVWFKEGTLFNEFILREGFALAYFAFPFRKDFQERFRKAQNEARESGRGLWLEGSPEVLPSSLAKSHIGKLTAIRFVCAKVRKLRSFTFLRAENDGFEALIPRQRRAFFPSVNTYQGQTLIAIGFLEAHRERPQIMLFFPSQLRLDDRPED
ncbi:MAG: thermonuclease family protein [Candidatus Aminicenantales bacterium]